MESARAQVASRGWIKGSPVLGDAEVDGFIQSLGGANADDANTKRKETPAQLVSTGGYTDGSLDTDSAPSCSPHPGLSCHRAQTNLPDAVRNALDQQASTPHERLGDIPDEIGTLDFTLAENDASQVFRGDDQRAEFKPSRTPAPAQVLESASVDGEWVGSIQPLLEYTDVGLQRTLINCPKHVAPLR